VQYKDTGKMHTEGEDKNSSIFSYIRVAVCGNLPTACNYLLKHGVVLIDTFLDATEMPDEQAYHLILVYAPQAEGLLNVRYSRDADQNAVPVRLLNEPCCDSALVELKSTLRVISEKLGIGG